MSNKPNGKRAQCGFAAMQGNLAGEQTAAEYFWLKFQT